MNKYCKQVFTRQNVLHGGRCQLSCDSSVIRWLFERTSASVSHVTINSDGHVPYGHDQCRTNDKREAEIGERAFDCPQEAQVQTRQLMEA